jgi:RNA polymerase sigma factor (TIGR02999 family)
MNEITSLLRSAGGGDPAAVGRLFEVLYAELRQIAHARLRADGRPAQLDTTQLVHESYLRLIRLERLRVEDRGHFLAYAARVMRSVVVDLVRESRAERRGGGVLMVTLDTLNGGAVAADSDEILRVHDALEELSSIDERMVRVVEMRYFANLEMDEIALALDVGKRTVERDWEKARSFLYASLKRD